jgi:hypothetical protein
VASTLVRTWHDVVFIWGFVHPWTGLEVDGPVNDGSVYFYTVCFCVLKVFFKKFNYYYYFFILN